MTMLDPWRHAADIAERLQQPDGSLITVLGAQAWCDKCRRLRPEFERLAARQGRLLNTAWLWLDLEDHAEFLGRFIPEDLPLLLHFREGRLLECGIVEAFENAGWRLQPMNEPENLPSLWATFSMENWAK
ncbi:hypothetical protein VAPA_1c02580 [Variovorax paradoxus B4]|uniref:Thioredoxin n=1 Tax=Variovorax paradoxus B4 TaxID=1246301 RepID=T1X450_VARPD|nr:thioredoxin family protein [Variovorax paradoxus]AGU47388.1 hypothetical protein VAPA_1c02580 [Variovorax paradoxus B4]